MRFFCEHYDHTMDTPNNLFGVTATTQVQQALQEAARNRSVMVIAHRLSTVTGADVVAVVQSGSVVESGTHSSLMAAGGAYSQLVQRQVFGAGGGGGEALQEVVGAGSSSANGSS
jgi:ABC-type transport system involved in cytochrome bd biosynthesis fused ATPase/permease subunit